MSPTFRVNRLSLLILAMFLIIGFNLVRMQIVKGSYYRSLSERNRIRVIYLEAPRGRIVDRQGTLLAGSRLSFNCSAIQREAKRGIKRSCEVLSPILKVDAAELEKRFHMKKPGLFNTVIIAEDIPPEQAMAIEEKLDFLPGFMIETRPCRQYPYGDAAAHLTGYVGPINAGEVEEFELYGYRRADWMGREGIEKMYESYLRGRSGGLQLEVDSRGRFVRALGIKEPKEGKDVGLTIDAELQDSVQKLLKNQKGAVIVMELGEGGILAMNSSPSFDSNLFATAQGRKKVGQYLHNRSAPMVNRGIRGRYPPGSIFKIITALAALGERKIYPGATKDCPGYLSVGGKIFRCWSEAGHGPENLTEAFSHSCNVYFYLAGLAAGPDAIFRKAVEFGFSRATGIDLPGEKEGFVPSRDWKRSRHGQSWFDGETANLSIGQGALQVTPIQALVMIAAAATEGQMIRPHLIDKIEGVKVAERHARHLSEPKEHWQAVKAGLDQVVNSESGTGRLARVPGLRVAGKTGTAESGQDKTHAWFVGFAPEDDPKIAMVVFLEHGGRGGVTAARLASAVFQRLREKTYL